MSNAPGYVRLSVALLLSLLLHGRLAAQPYEHAAGIRAGYSSGITYKGFFRHTDNAVEADFYYNNHGLNIAAFYSWNFSLSAKDRFFFYTGPGLMGGQWDEAISLGICAQAGLMYVPRKVPLDFSLGWRPLFNLYKHTEPDFLDFGLVIRYRFSV